MTKCLNCYGENADGATSCRWCNHPLYAPPRRSSSKVRSPTTVLSMIVILGAILLFGSMGVNKSCGGGGPRNEEPVAERPASQRAAADSTSPSSAGSLEKMAAVFVGAPSRALIKAQMDRALGLYGLPIDEHNYNRYGSVLVRMRQDSGVSEMEMLRFVIALREESPEVKVELTDAIALAATSLEESN